MSQEQQSQLKQLIAKGKIQGFLTYAEVNDHLPSDIVDPEQIDDFIGMINDMGIQVYEVAPIPRRSLPMTKMRKKSPLWLQSIANSAGRRIRFACTCGKWVQLNY
jgi:Sigma-70 factor, region 1.1